MGAAMNSINCCLRCGGRPHALHIVGEIRAGRIEVAPANPDHCRWCDFRDVCRIEAQRAVGIAEGA